MNQQKAGKDVHVVYTVATCKSDAAVANHPCIGGFGPTFEGVFGFSLIQLKQVIAEVGAAKFQRIVPLVTVGNEDLVISPTDHETFNTADLQSALDRVKAELTTDGITLTTSTAQGMDVSSVEVIDQMLHEGQDLVSHYTPGAPVIENIYGAQFPISQIPDAISAIDFLIQRVAAMQNFYPNNPAMLGETGWWTAGEDAGYQFAMPPYREGTLADAKDYMNNVYVYAKGCDVPMLISEAYDGPTKMPAGIPVPAGQEQAEQHYGLFDPYNALKDSDLIPSPPVPNYDTSGAALFTFNGFDSNGTLKPNPLTIKVNQPGNLPTYTEMWTAYRENIPPGGTQVVWKTVNLYGSSDPVNNPKGGSKVILYHSDGTEACTNWVVSVNKASPGPGVGAFSGGKWFYTGTNAPGCSGVNWGDGVTAPQNVFLDPNL